jgi:hypothetical protein
MSEEGLRYPTGRFSPQENYNLQELEQLAQRIEGLPSRIGEVIRHFSLKDFETAYREGGWSARQVIHHVADSHMNAYIRFKWALTEDTPVIKAYNEKLWAETPEVKLDPQLSLVLLNALHAKWVGLIRSLAPEDFKREYIHPDTKKSVRLDRLVAMYAWHGDHHLGHLKIVAAKST